MPRGVTLIGVPVNSSGTADGVARAPGVLRERGLAAALGTRPGFGCGGWSVCIYNPDLDPDRHAADDIIDFVKDALR
jgi:hypothetical protein